MKAGDNHDRRARWRLPASHVDSLVAVLSAGLGHKRVTAEHRAVIRRICLAPELAHYAPEDSLIGFKLAIGEAADAARLAPGPNRTDLLAKLVSVYIEEFYLASSTMSASGPDDRQGMAAGR